MVLWSPFVRSIIIACYSEDHCYSWIENYLEQCSWMNPSRVYWSLKATQDYKHPSVLFKCSYRRDHQWENSHWKCKNKNKQACIAFTSLWGWLIPLIKSCTDKSSCFVNKQWKWSVCNRKPIYRSQLDRWKPPRVFELLYICPGWNYKGKRECEDLSTDRVGTQCYSGIIHRTQNPWWRSGPTEQNSPVLRIEWVRKVWYKLNSVIVKFC